MVGKQGQVQTQLTPTAVTAPQRKPIPRAATPRLAPEAPAPAPAEASAAPRAGFEFANLAVLPQTVVEAEQPPSAVPDDQPATAAPAQAPQKGKPTAAAVRETSSARAKAQDAQTDALRRINRLLRTGILDWRVTEREANEALEILNGLEPEVLLPTVQAMQFTGAWGKFQKRVPSSDALSQLNAHINPLTGYLMRGDTIRLQFFVGGVSEAELSGDYTLTEAGLALPLIKEPLALVGRTPQEAVNAIGQSYVDGMLLADPSIRLYVRTRGTLYPPTPGVLPEIPREFSARAVPHSTGAKRRAHEQEFSAYIKGIRPTDPFTTCALLYYMRWITDTRDKDEFFTRTPPDLWKWALSQAAKPPPRVPLEPYWRLADEMSERAHIAPPQEAKRLLDALLRFDQWLDAHAADPNLETYDPTEIWLKAYRGALDAELRAERAERERQARMDAAAPPVDWDKAGKKLDDALRFLMTRVYPMPAPRAYAMREEFQEKGADYERDVRYLLYGSEREKQARQRIGSEFLDSVVGRMTAPDFLATTAEQDFYVWIGARPDYLVELQLAQAQPEVYRFEGDKEIPTWQTVIDFSILLVPVVGQIAGGYEVVWGEDLFGHELTPVERAVLGAAIFLPAAVRAFKVSKGALKAAELVKLYGVSGEEAKVLVTAMTAVKPGSAGHKLLTEAVEVLGGGKRLKDTKLIAGLRDLFGKMGLTNAAAADELAKAKGLKPTARAAGEAEELLAKARSELDAAASKAESAGGAPTPQPSAVAVSAAEGGVTASQRAAVKKMIVEALQARTQLTSVTTNSKLASALADLRSLGGTPQGEIFTELADLTEVVNKALQTPDLYADVLTEAIERSLKGGPKSGVAGLSAVEDALAVMSQETGAQLKVIPKEVKDLPSVAFYQDYAGTSARFIDYGAREAAPAHGAFTHLIQDLVVDRGLKGVSLKSASLRELLTAIGGNPNVVYSHTYRNLLSVISIHSDRNVGRMIWEATFDFYEEAPKSILQPEAIYPVLEYLTGVR